MMTTAHRSQTISVLAMGNNADGQLGIGMSEDEDDRIWNPHLVTSLEDRRIIAAVASSRHSAWLSEDGTVFTAGDNDEGQLGRQGRRTRPGIIESIQHLPVEDVAVGDGFTVMAASLDGRLLGVGKGERGQLGMGGADRDHKDTVKFSSALGEEQLLLLVAGEAHAAGLSRSGKVMVFGENKVGQLGLGDFVSTATPKPVPMLISRPVVGICCGAAHTLARTVSGLLWAWGSNERGQLGLGDLKTRFKPEQVKSLRVSRCAAAAAGARHTLALSERGLIFSWGAGGCGQLGSGGFAESEATPNVVHTLRDVGKGLRIACGHSHSLAWVHNEDSERDCLYGWGLGSSGQLGLSPEALQDRKYAPLPQQIRLEGKPKVLDICSGPLAHHTFLLVAGLENTSASAGDTTETATPQPGYPSQSCPSTTTTTTSSAAGYPSSSLNQQQQQQQQEPASTMSSGFGWHHQQALRTALDTDELLARLRRLVAGEASSVDPGQLKALVQAVGQAFSSASVLNASFRKHGGPMAVSEEDSGLDLLKVRTAYHTLIFDLNNRDVIRILGRATLSICDHLAKQKVPADDPENLRVFLVLFENPLLLSIHGQELFSSFHLAVQHLVSAVCALPKDSQRVLFGWLRQLPSEYFHRAVDVVEQYVTFVLTKPGHNQSDASAAILMLGTLFNMNRDMGGIIPERSFHNEAVSASRSLEEHYKQWVAQKREGKQSVVFSYCSYPFLLGADAKRRLLNFDAKMALEVTLQELTAQCLREHSQVDLNKISRICVRRSRVLGDLAGQLWWRMQRHPNWLRFPLAVEFVGEEGVDAGGIRKECLQVAMQDLYKKTSLFVELEECPGLCWFRPRSKDREEYCLEIEEESPPPDCDCYDGSWRQNLPKVVGAIVGLAVYNQIYLDLRLHPLIYRFLIDRSSSNFAFEDLLAIHPTLHRSLATLRSATDVRSLCLSWSVQLPSSDITVDLSKGPAALPPLPSAEGDDDEALLSSADDAHRFSERYAEAAVLGLAQRSIDDFLAAALECMAPGPSYELCTWGDLEVLVCGSPDLGDFKDLERCCEYGNGLSSADASVELFWTVVRELPESKKRKLLLFCTGSDRVPILGLKALKFVLAKSLAPPDHLPTANICINQLNWPEYPSLDVARTRLLAALEHHAGFGFR